MTEPLSFSQICLTAPEFLVNRRQSSGALGDSLFEHLCDPLLLAGALGLLQSDSGLVGRDTQEEPFDLGLEISSPRASYQPADALLKAERDGPARARSLAHRRCDHA